MAAVLRVPSVSLNGELGEMRANDAQMAWRGSSGAIVVIDLSSVTSAEWCHGRLIISHSDTNGAAQTKLEGFGADYYESISAHFEQHAHIFVVGGCEDAEKETLPTLLGSNSKTDAEKLAGVIIKPQVEPEEPSAVEEHAAIVQKAKVESPEPEAGRGTLVQRRIASSDDDEGLSCLFDEGFAPKAFDARTHPYFRSSKNAIYGTSLFEGYVWKQSAWVKKWEKRYMVLSTTGLFSYKARSEIEPSVIFEGVVSCSASEDKSGSKGFCIVTREGLLVKRHFIAAETDAARDQWVTKINVALLRNQQ